MPTHHSVLPRKDPASPKPHWTMRLRSLAVLSGVPSSCHPGPPPCASPWESHPALLMLAVQLQFEIYSILPSTACPKPSKKGVSAVRSWETHGGSLRGSLGHAHTGVLALRVQHAPCPHTPGRYITQDTLGTEMEALNHGNIFSKTVLLLR